MVRRRHHSRRLISALALIAILCQSMLTGLHNPAAALARALSPGPADPWALAICMPGKLETASAVAQVPDAQAGAIDHADPGRLPAPSGTAAHPCFLCTAFAVTVLSVVASAHALLNPPGFAVTWPDRDPLGRQQSSAALPRSRGPPLPL